MNDNTLLLLGLLGALVASQADATTYTFTTLDAPGALSTWPSGINDKGQITGYYYDGSDSHGFLESGGMFTTFDVPGATATYPRGINGSGQITGYYNDNGGRSHGFVKSGDTFTSLDVPGAITTYVYGINDSGQMVGIFANGSGGYGHWFVESGGTFTTLDPPTPTRVIPLVSMIVGKWRVITIMPLRQMKEEKGFGIALPRAAAHLPPSISRAPGTLMSGASMIVGK